MGLVVLRRYANPSEAHAVVAGLQACGVNAMSLDDQVTPPYSGMPVMGGFRVAVADDQAALAATTLQKLQLRPAPTGPMEEAEDEGEYDAWWEERAKSYRPVVSGPGPLGKAFIWYYLLMPIWIPLLIFLMARLFASG